MKVEQYAGAIDPYEPRKGVDLYSEVAPRIILPENLPYLIYGIGIARSGTTVSLNVMTSSLAKEDEGKEFPIRAGYQHFKAGYRHAMHGWPNDNENHRWEFKIPDAHETPVFYIKDPLGPYTHTESVYNPLNFLQMKDYPIDRTFLLFFFRDPREILASWKRNWGKVRDPQVLRENLITSCLTLQDIHKQALAKGYPNEVYLYESLRDYEPAEVIGKLFSKINDRMQPNAGVRIQMTDHTVGGWDPDEKKRIWHPDEPEIYERAEIAELHSMAKSSDKLRYKKYSQDDLQRYLNDEDITELTQSGALAIYEYFRCLYNSSNCSAVAPLK